MDRNLFLWEALGKTQNSGANTRLALIIFKGGNGNWIFLLCLAEARLSRHCFNILRASGSNIVPGPRGLTGHGDVMHICDMLYASCYSHTLMSLLHVIRYGTGIIYKNGDNFRHAPGWFLHASCLLIFKGKTLAVSLGGGATCVFALFIDLAKPLEDTLSNMFGCLRTQKCSDTRFHSCLLNW